MDKFAQSIYDKISFIFDEFVLLPTYFNIEDRKRYTFVAKPRKQENFERLKVTLQSIKSGLEVNDVKNVKHGHEFHVGENKVIILYAKNDGCFDFFCGVSSYGINSILGKMVKPAGLKLTQNGLIYEEILGIDNHQSKVGEFTVTSDTRGLMELLELNYFTFKKGFNSKEEMFEFVMSSPYFNSKKFIEPKKEFRLGIYLDLQAYLILKNVNSSDCRNISFDIVDKAFSDIDFYGEVDKLKEKERRKREAIQKFNGRTILDHYPDFDKKKIGASMSYFKHSFDGLEGFRDFLIDNSTEEVMKKFKEVVQF